MSIDLDAAKKTLLELQEEYQTRIDTIEDHIQNPQDELNKDWEDQAISIRQNDTRQLPAEEARQNLIYVNEALSRIENGTYTCLLYTSPSPRDRQKSRMPSSA